MQEHNGVFYEDPIHEYFGLSYAHWLVVPRVALQSMPYKWQATLVELLEELDDKIDWVPKEGNLYVSMRDDRGRHMKGPDLPHYRHNYMEMKDGSDG